MLFLSAYILFMYVCMYVCKTCCFYQYNLLDVRSISNKKYSFVAFVHLAIQHVSWEPVVCWPLC